jgi:hypothetical protein
MEEKRPFVEILAYPAASREKCARFHIQKSGRRIRRPGQSVME